MQHWTLKNARSTSCVLPKHLTPVRGDDELSFDTSKRNSFTSVLWDHAVFLRYDVNADDFL